MEYSEAPEVAAMVAGFGARWRREGERGYGFRV
jgi:hypothetical protein